MLCTCHSASYVPSSSPTPTHPVCDEFSAWPHIDGGVTCGSETCTALVHTQPYGGRCDVYCESFGHMCAGAAEEMNENCEVKERAQCDEEIAGTSDMLCTCHSASYVPSSSPTPTHPVRGLTLMGGSLVAARHVRPWYIRSLMAAVVTS